MSEQTCTITGTVNATGSLFGEVESSGELSGVMNKGQGTPHYQGTYEVQSAFNDDFYMLTKGKKMDQNVKVKNIPYGEVANPSGGKTITIG